VTQSRAELLRNERDLTTKWEQPWPQLVCCASIYCRVDENQREFDLETRVTTNGNLLIPEMFHSCALNK